MTTTNNEQYVSASPAALAALARAAARIAEVMRQGAAEERLAHCALAELAPALGMAHGAVFLHAGFTFSLMADTGSEAQPCPLASVSVDDLLAAAGARARFMTDPREIARLTDGASAVQSLIIIPLAARTMAMGAIVLGSTAPKAGSTAEGDLLTLLGQCLACELREAMLHRQLADAAEKLSAQNERLHHVSISDPLTGLSNRQHFLDEIARETDEALARNTPLSLLLIDADHFKAVNDRYGLHFGDEVIRRIAEGIQQTIRGRDLGCRFDGQRFSVLLPNTPGTGAVVVAEHLRENISALTLFENEGTWALTVSIGVACLSPRVAGADHLLAKADACLREAKAMGGNQIVFDWDELLAVMGDNAAE